MNYPMSPMQQMPQAITVYPTDPYVVQTLQSIVGKYVVIETTRGSIQGTVQSCKPDHVIIMGREKSFFVRISEIVWIMPE